MPPWHHILLGPQGFRLREWLESGAARVIKRGSGRTVYRIDLPERALFVKHFHRATLWKAGGRLLAGKPPQREFHRAVELARRDVPAPMAVAIGQPRWWSISEGFLVTEAIPNSCTLSIYLDQVLPRMQAADRLCARRMLFTALAQLCATSHRAGVYHDDLHPGNILVRMDSLPRAPGGRRQPGQQPRLHLVDLPGVRLSGPLGWRNSRKSLVMLGAACLGQASQGELWRFWLAYLAHRPELGPVDVRRCATRILRDIPRQACRVAFKRDRRSLRRNRDFWSLRDKRALAHAVTDLPGAVLAGLVEDPERLLRDNQHRPVKLTHRSVVVEAELPLAGARVRVAYKRTTVKTWFKAFAALFRRSRAVRAWYQGHALLTRGIATARPLAVYESRRLGLRWHSYLATQWIEGAQDLHLYAWRIAQLGSAERRLRTRQCAQAVGRLVGRMHAWGVTHRDLKGCNLVVSERGERVDAYLIDADGVHIARRVSEAAKVRNLARLATSLEAHPWIGRADRLRFLRAYLKELGRPQDEWRSLWRIVARSSRKIISRLRRAGRPIV